jgi:hypothetical protein
LKIIGNSGVGCGFGEAVTIVTEFDAAASQVMAS